MLEFLSDKSELIHPLVSHLPIGLLIGAVIVFAVRLIPTSEKIKELAKTTFWFNLSIGLFALGLGLFTGDFAAEKVRGDLCDVFAVQAHEDAAYYSIYWFSAVMLLGVMIDFSGWVKSITLRRAGLVTLAILLIFATQSLFETGHKGALLVYEQGAGVNPKAFQCRY